MEFTISEIQVKEEGQNQMKHCFVRLTTVIAVGAACYAVKAELLDRSGAVISGGYYVYCRMQASPADRNE